MALSFPMYDSPHSIPSAATEVRETCRKVTAEFPGADLPLEKAFSELGKKSTQVIPRTAVLTGGPSCGKSTLLQHGKEKEPVESFTLKEEGWTELLELLEAALKDRSLPYGSPTILARHNADLVFNAVARAHVASFLQIDNDGEGATTIFDRGLGDMMAILRLVELTYEAAYEKGILSNLGRGIARVLPSKDGLGELFGSISSEDARQIIRECRESRAMLTSIGYKFRYKAVLWLEDPGTYKPNKIRAATPGLRKMLKVLTHHMWTRVLNYNLKTVPVFWNDYDGRWNHVVDQLDKAGIGLSQ